MLLTWGLGAVGGLIAGPPGAIALGGLGAAIECGQALSDDVDLQRSERKAAETASEELGRDRHEPQWNAHLGIWETPYNAYLRKKKEAASGVQPTPTRATTSRWEDPVDPAFQ